MRDFAQQMSRNVLALSLARSRKVSVAFPSETPSHRLAEALGATGASRAKIEPTPVPYLSVTMNSRTAARTQGEIQLRLHKQERASARGRVRVGRGRAGGRDRTSSTASRPRVARHGLLRYASPGAMFRRRGAWWPPPPRCRIVILGGYRSNIIERRYQVERCAK